MLRQRLLVIILLLPAAIYFIAVGGIAFNILITIIMSVAAYEYYMLMQKGSWQPSRWLVVVGTAAICIMRALFSFRYSEFTFSIIILTALTVHLIAYEKGRDQAPIDFGITIGGIFYIGWLGAYLISLRSLDHGLWWFMLMLPAAWLADSAAYLIGSRYGKHKLVPRLSPKKTWEGFWAGVIGGIIGGGLLALVWGLRFPVFTFAKGAIAGGVIGLLTPLGDLGESMFKRMVGEKDSSNFIPGHGGFFDRINSWLWAGVIGYYLATLVWKM